MEINEKIKVAREFRQMTQKELAQHLDITPQSYSRLEKGEHHFSFEQIEAIAQALNMDLCDLLKIHEGTKIVIINNGKNDHSQNYNYYDLNSSLEDKNQLIKALQDSIQSLKETIDSKNKTIQLLEEKIAALNA